MGTQWEGKGRVENERVVCLQRFPLPPTTCKVGIPPPSPDKGETRVVPAPPRNQLPKSSAASRGTLPLLNSLSLSGVKGLNLKEQKTQRNLTFRTTKISMAHFSGVHFFIGHYN